MIKAIISILSKYSDTGVNVSEYLDNIEIISKIEDHDKSSVETLVIDRVPTSSGNHGKPGKSLKQIPCMENHGI